MFAFFGLGLAEMIILGIIGMIVLAVPIFVIVAVSTGSRKKLGTSDTSEVDELRAEVKRLRDEVARLKDANKNGPSDGIASGEP